MTNDDGTSATVKQMADRQKDRLKAAITPTRPCPKCGTNYVIKSEADEQKNPTVCPVCNPGASR
jgi:hypothetical protein